MSNSDILSREITKDFRRGLLKFFILKMLDRESMHGYAMMARIEKVSGWKPSSGSMYPALMNLHTSGLIGIKVKDLRKIYSITKKGKDRINQLNENFDDGLNAIRMIFNNL
ncbi:MAG: PadR family transcriptional regulator [Thermoplasmata archaeon]|nr:PadR family transcriptional regulator [Thermoplasmata archaeon]